ncbi:hypothetical protein FMM75_21285 [Lachnospiraceae bacterium MD335]|nr:hypothetical protein C809_04240 [Lachnospiraceae bacterium MD335]NDO51804.1 hypothetical protein [Lachnospiraceae bacterium MD335]
MPSDKCPKELGNAENIISKTTQEKFRVIKKLEKTFDFISEEPLTISLKKAESSKAELFTRILRIRIWLLENKNISWNVFSKDREIYQDLIIRKVVWNLDKDAKRLKKKNKDIDQKVLSEFIPSADIRNIYIPPSQAKHLIKLINQLDAEIAEGFILKKKCRSKRKWKKLEVLRLYNWGQIHCKWSPNRKNKDVQKKIRKLLLELDKFIEKFGQNIFEMTLNYYSEDSGKIIKIWEGQNEKR